MSSKKGQVTLFVIIAIMLVASIALATFFGFRPFGLPSQVAPVEDQVLGCLNARALEGLEIMGEQGGYIELPEFEAGSEYAPSTSQLNFFGSVMPFWFYLSQNGVYREQVPSIRMMESQLSAYISQNAADCDFSQFEEQGYVVTVDQPSSVKVDIREDKVFVDAEWPVTVDYQQTSRRVTSHSTGVDSNFGKMYNLATALYDKHKGGKFLEEYTVDMLALYAPGTGVELTCSPKIWKKDEVRGEILSALKDNIPTVRVKGDYYSLSNKERSYFVKDLGLDLGGAQVNFLYDQNFPTKIEISPSSDDLLRADPIGNQEGLGILGFCYVPYHFVYTVTYPVVIQIFDERYGLFQFPVIVSVEDNKPRGERPIEATEGSIPMLCQNKLQTLEVSTIDLDGNDVDAEVSFKCANEVCRIGYTEDGKLETEFPQCANGFIIAKSEGYADAKTQVSTNEVESAEIVMKPKHTLDVVVLKDLVRLEEGETALVTFSSEDATESMFYPDQSRVNLVEGNYKVTSYLFKEGKIVLQAQTTEKCIGVPRKGLLGVLGLESEQCYTISQPAQELSQLTIGGGTTTVRLTEEDLAQANFVGVEIGSQPTPRNVLELQDVYNNIASSAINVVLKQ